MMTKNYVDNEIDFTLGGSIIINKEGANPLLKNIMTTKPWFQSKTVLFNLFMTILGVLAIAKDSFPQYATSLIFAITVGNLILRIWFTSSAIAPDVTA